MIGNIGVCLTDLTPVHRDRGIATEAAVVLRRQGSLR